jgi:hypothetical protein
LLCGQGKHHSIPPEAGEKVGTVHTATIGLIANHLPVVGSHDADARANGDGGKVVVTDLTPDRLPEVLHGIFNGWMPDLNQQDVFPHELILSFL